MSTQKISEEESLLLFFSGSLPGVLRFDDPDADIILRSCDHHEFRVLKLYLIKVSPVLRELIQSASNSHAAANATVALASVQLSDSGATLSGLLTFILPILPILPSTIEQTMILLSAAQKYNMDIILDRIRAVLSLQNPSFIGSKTAFQAYSLAQKYGLRQEALQAARSTLTFSFALEDLEDKLGTIPGIYLHELWKYHQNVRAHLRVDLTAFRTNGIPSTMAGQPCGYGTLTRLGEYINSIAEFPALFDITEFHMLLSRHSSAWGYQCHCANIPSQAIHAFWMALTDVVHSCMTKVSVDYL